MKARPTVYKGIQMRSRLEAGFAGWLDRKRKDWEYEPNCYADEVGQYLPDFLVRQVLFFPDSLQRLDVYIEVKPTMDVIDWGRISHAAKVLHPAILVLVVADTGTYYVYPHADLPNGLLRLVWVHDDAPGDEDPPLDSVALTFAAFEPPFARDWWKP